eukprot:TRINITY_DN31155_c0_g1_i1.p1 TRINITY_DN31155_c0_g1~~TRINITY_DN31155_c0_g1_i1.p1  ORF type:complete len:517 (+),score=63.89 TRINITY_DN31155_c0_g1_i1:78-1628(+)
MAGAGFGDMLDSVQAAGKMLHIVLDTLTSDAPQASLDALWEVVMNKTHFNYSGVTRFNVDLLVAGSVGNLLGPVGEAVLRSKVLLTGSGYLGQRFLPSERPFSRSVDMSTALETTALSPSQQVLAAEARELLNEAVKLLKGATLRLNGLGSPLTLAGLRGLTGPLGRDDTCRTVQEILDVHISTSLATVHACSSQWADAVGDVELVDQAFFERAALSRRLAEAYGDYGLFVDLCCEGLHRLRVLSGVGATFGHSLKKYLMELTKVAPACHRYWLAWAALVQSVACRRLSNYVAALAHADEAGASASRLLKKKPWSRDGGSELFGDRLELGIARRTPLQVLMDLIADETSISGHLSVRDAAREGASASSADISTKAEGLTAALRRLVAQVLPMEAKLAQLKGDSSEDMLLKYSEAAYSEMLREMAGCRSLEHLHKISAKVLAMYDCSSDVDQTRAAAASFESHCAFCNKSEADVAAKFLYCPCKTVKYCGKVYQKAHGKARHKADCAVRLAAQGRPS